MEAVQLHGTDLRTSRLAYGTASLHRRWEERSRIELLRTAFECGITHFDTSPYYGFGLSETVLGHFLRDLRHRVTVASKVGLYPPGISTSMLGLWLRKGAGRVVRRFSEPHADWSVAEAEQSLHGSLRRLRTDYLDVLFLHEPDHQQVASEAVLDWLQRAHTAGKIRYWGLAGNTAALLRLVEMNSPLAAVVQCRDSLRGHEADVVRRLRPLQLTYGYLAAEHSVGIRPAAPSIIREALKRNARGSVIFSSSHPSRIQEVARVCQ